VVNKKMAKENWVDFKEIKKKIGMEMVLEHYGLLEKLNKSGQNLVGCCPIHKGSNPRQFSVNLERNIFNCFGNCKSGGNVLDFVAKVEGVSLRDAALLLRDRFLSDVSGNDDTQVPQEVPAPKKRVREKNEASDKDDKDQVNPPLTFKLKTIDPEHSFFDEHGIEAETIKHFGLGFCSKGIMKNRIVIPIHNEKNELVAYCGRAISEKQIEKDGKYKLPSKFVKSAVVYNLNRQKENENLLVLVESFFSVFKLHQAGFPNTLALMGSALSDEQENLIVDRLGHRGRVILLFDADDSGRKCTEGCLARLSSKVFVKLIDISPHARKPHQLTSEQIQNLI
jgi:DNA primase